MSSTNPRGTPQETEPECEVCDGSGYCPTCESKMPECDYCETCGSAGYCPECEGAKPGQEPRASAELHEVEQREGAHTVSAALRPVEGVAWPSGDETLKVLVNNRKDHKPWRRFAFGPNIPVTIVPNGGRWAVYDKTVHRLELVEEWRKVEGWPYEVSDLGRVKGLRSGKVLTSTSDRDGYLRLSAHRGYPNEDRKTFLVHRLIAEAFIPNPEGKPHINHLDNDRKNNRVTNLEWCTPKENTAHGIKHGNIDPRKGSRHPQARLHEREVPVLRHMYRIGWSSPRLGRVFGISAHSAWKVATGRTWTHV